MSIDAVVDSRLTPPAVTRERTLDLAGELLATRGLAALSVDAVAERAGTTRSALERWWPTEEALALDVLRQEWVELAVHVYGRCASSQKQPG